MEKTIIIDGKDVKFRSSGAVTILYKSQFQRDFFTDLADMGASFAGIDLSKMDQAESLQILRKVNFDLFLNIAWVFAKLADKSIPEPFSWLDSFETFPIVEIMPELQDLLAATISSKKK